MMIVPRRVLGGPLYTAPSDELTRGVIGVGGMGRGHMTYDGARLLAVCDVDQDHLDLALEAAGPEVDGYSDYRELLARPDIDIVHIVTPPHWHGRMAVDAANAGKDIWCEKPMTRTIGEGERVVDAVRRNGTIFRLNTWFRFRDPFYGLGSEVAPLKKLVMAGAFGWPIRARIGAVTGFDWKLDQWVGRTGLRPQEVPTALDYDRWLGPAPYKPYHPHRVHQSFRGYWDYDAGGLGDMGQHYLDPVQYLLGKDETSPVEIDIDAPQQHPDAVGTWREIRMRYADGCEIVLDGASREGDEIFIEGPAGWVRKDMRSNLGDLRAIAATLPEAPARVTDFSEAVRTRQRFALDAEIGHHSCTLVNLGAIALRLRRRLHFDPATGRFPGDDEANRLLDPPARASWGLA
jgi:predicted dehydrogenase